MSRREGGTRHLHQKNLNILKRLRINNQIHISPVRLIDEAGKQTGVVELEKALQYARERDLDLVEIVPKTRPPVCRVMDYGKYQYQQERKGRVQKKQKAGEIKGVRITPRISSHDLETKAHQIEKFLKKNYKVRIEMMLRGREKALEGFARSRVQDLLNAIQEPAYKIEQELKKSPRGLNMIISHLA